MDIGTCVFSADFYSIGVVQGSVSAKENIQLLQTFDKLLLNLLFNSCSYAGRDGN